MAESTQNRHKTHLYLVRHGQTEFNRRRIVQGRGVDASLNETGVAQAMALSRRFASTPLNAIYSSPLARASETARIVLENQEEIPIYFDTSLEEMSWGIYEGKPVKEDLIGKFDELRERWHKGDYDFCVPDGESLRQVQQRGLNAINTILQSHPGLHVMVVAHGRFLRILLASLLKEYGISRMEEIAHTNTGVNHLVHENDVFKAKILNCTVHLDENPSFKR